MILKNPVLDSADNYEIYSVDETHMPGQIHIGDITSDGYPDLILTLRKSYFEGETEVHILQNTPCSAKLCNEKSVKNKRRVFMVKSYSQPEQEPEPAKKGIQFPSFNQIIMDSVWQEMGVKDKGREYKRVLSAFKHVKYAAFFDLIENSMLDILMVTDDPIEGLQIRAVFNNIDRTAMFLKARILSDSNVGTVI